MLRVNPTTVMPDLPTVTIMAKTKITKDFLAAFTSSRTHQLTLAKNFKS
jgi:hypothetical protein